MSPKYKGCLHIGYAALEMVHGAHNPIVIDVENTSSYGCFFIDMVMDRNEDPLPRVRDYGWSLNEIIWLKSQPNTDFVAFKHRYATLKEAESARETSTYHTDSIVALWSGSTTTRKMKQAMSIDCC